MVVAEPSVKVRFGLTICAVARPRFTEIPVLVVKEKSSVSVPPPDSSIVSLPRDAFAPKMYVSFPNPPINLSSPGPPLRTLASVFPVNVSFSDPPITFSIVVAEPSVRVSVGLTICAVARPRFTEIPVFVVAEKSSVSVPPPDSSIVSLPKETFASKMYVSFPNPPVSKSSPAPPVRVSLPAPPISVSFPLPPSRKSLPRPPFSVSLPEPP